MENSKAYIKFIISLLIFGSNGLVASLIDLSSHQIVLLRTLIGGIFLSAILLYQKKPLAALKNKRHFFFVVMSGVSMGISWLFLYEAYNCSGVSLATLIYYCGPVLVMILSPILFKESFTPAKIFGFTAVLLGMLCVNFNSLTGEGFSKGILYSSLGALFFALMTVLNKKGSSITGIENSAVSILSSCATAAVFTAVRYGLSFEIPVNSIAPIIFIGIVNTGLDCFILRIFRAAFSHCIFSTVLTWNSFTFTAFWRLSNYRRRRIWRSYERQSTCWLCHNKNSVASYSKNPLINYAAIHVTDI